ncbi:MAG: DUF1800 domain-containing protein [Gammaproteobacteria bacterium]|nr:DUF1800 domain-containing protein [Gammaproteobacteria bacterium]MDH3409309.1 DUF1800 domain-containing protein [Gammaproteobacteria bacterium]
MRTDAAIAANRFGLGARPADLQKVDRNPQAWLLDQLQGPSRQPGELRSLPDTADVLVEMQDLRRERRDMRNATEAALAPDIVKAYGRTIRRHYLDQSEARYRLAARSDYPFFERLVHFWSNHFAVSADKQPMPALAGLYENEAIRPNVTANFADLLIACEQHPAMILYLDNQRSVGPGSRLGRRANRARREREVGLNENLAREILELHTLGVHGGYTQGDVTTFAKVITGWSIGGAGENARFAEGEPGHFEFRDAIHEPGAHEVLGQHYPQKGIAQGEAVLRDLAAHPSTARCIATKLARHFVADEPPQALIDELTASYLESGGELTSVYETLVGAKAAWAAPLSKYKTPHDFVISTFRAFDHVPDSTRFVVGALDLMGQTPFRPGSPAGWPDTADHWGGADALYKRIEWSNTVSRVVGSRINPVELGDAVLGPTLSAESRKAVSRAESNVQGMTLLLASPDFQRR